jgi:hypothetical protein
MCGVAPATEEFEPVRHLASADLGAVPSKRRYQPPRWRRWFGDGPQERLAVLAAKDHTLMILEDAAACGGRGCALLHSPFSSSSCSRGQGDVNRATSIGDDVDPAGSNQVA